MGANMDEEDITMPTLEPPPIQNNNRTLLPNTNPTQEPDIWSRCARCKLAPCVDTYRMGVCLLKHCNIFEEQPVLSDYGWCVYCHSI